MLPTHQESSQSEVPTSRYGRITEGCEGPIRRPEGGGSEWELIKILLEGD
jgi:hypothetical protein